MKGLLSRPRVLTELESLQQLWRRHDLRDCVLQGLDLRGHGDDWATVEVRGTVFLGCLFDRVEEENELRRQGALIFPRFEGLPYDPYRASLYTWQELMEGYHPVADHSRDLEIYRHFERHGRHLPDVCEALAQRIHDHAIDDALRDFLDFDDRGLPRRRAVGLMGGHGTLRTDPSFVAAADLGRRLTRQGYLLVTGGGPGIMEAGNLGAYLAQEGESALDQALETLAAAPHYTDPGYVEAARDVLRSFPSGCESLAIPTWFYGHEPSNLFASSIAKYFSNSIREDGLLAICLYGVVFAPGSAGTTQEIFMDAVQNHYSTFGYRSPMVFLGRQRYERQTALFPLLHQLAKERGYADLLLLTDEVAEAVSFVLEHPPTLPEESSKAQPPSGG